MNARYVTCCYNSYKNAQDSLDQIIAAMPIGTDKYNCPCFDYCSPAEIERYEQAIDERDEYSNIYIDAVNYAEMTG